MVDDHRTAGRGDQCFGGLSEDCGAGPVEHGGGVEHQQWWKQFDATATEVEEETGERRGVVSWQALQFFRLWSSSPGEGNVLRVGRDEKDSRIGSPVRGRVSTK